MAQKTKNFWFKKRILITGAAGFIGANLTQKLVELGADVHIFIKATSSKWRIKEILGQITKHHCSLKGQANTQKLINKIKPQVIYHLAAYASRPLQKDINEAVKTNIIGTVNLLNALVDTDYDCFVNTGTSSEYGFKNKPMKETDLLEPTSFYAATKASATLFCQVFAKVFQKPIVTLRPFSVYGYWEPPARLISTAIVANLTEKSMKLVKKPQRDFIFIEDLIEAYLKAAQTDRLNGEIINVGSGKQHSNAEVIQKIEKITGKKTKIEKIPYAKRDWDTNFWVANNKKATRLLEWKPEHNFDRGLQKTISWFEENLQIYQDMSK